MRAIVPDPVDRAHRAPCLIGCLAAERAFCMASYGAGMTTPLLKHLRLATREGTALRITRTSGNSNGGGVFGRILRTRAARRSAEIGPAGASLSYLDPNIILQVALSADCDSLHPGCVFLSERANFAAGGADAKLDFVGPSPEAMTTRSDQSETRRTARGCI